MLNDLSGTGYHDSLEVIYYPAYNCPIQYPAYENEVYPGLVVVKMKEMPFCWNSPSKLKHA